MSPLPSLPVTPVPAELMTRLLPPYSALPPPPAMVKGSRELKSKLVSWLGSPRLQMARTGLATRPEKVMVSVPELGPPSIMTEVAPVGGPLLTTPPIQVLGVEVSGTQEGPPLRLLSWPV